MIFEANNGFTVFKYSMMSVSAHYNGSCSTVNNLHRL